MAASVPAELHRVFAERGVAGDEDLPRDVAFPVRKKREHAQPAQELDLASLVARYVRRGSREAVARMDSGCGQGQRWRVQRGDESACPDEQHQQQSRGQDRVEPPA